MTPAFKTSRTYPASASALAFPLGGIGTGNISLGARGELRDWEIFNRPAKGNTLPNTFFALWTRAGDGVPVAPHIRTATRCAPRHPAARRELTPRKVAIMRNAVNGLAPSCKQAACQGLRDGQGKEE